MGRCGRGQCGVCRLVEVGVLEILGASVVGADVTGAGVVFVCSLRARFSRPQHRSGSLLGGTPVTGAGGWGCASLDRARFARLHILFIH